MGLQPQLLTRLHLDLRGRRFAVDRDTIMNLPESVLLCLFPNGLVLSRQSMALSDGGGDGEEEDEQLYGVDVRLVYSHRMLFGFEVVADERCALVRPGMFRLCPSVLQECCGPFSWNGGNTGTHRAAAAPHRRPS